jgi:hypothetical protein
MNVHTAPLVIGATGGSGTRVVARIAKRAGYDFGANLNRSEDALDFVGFHDRWINRLLKAERKERSLPPEDADCMGQEFKEALTRHQSTIDASPAGGIQRWGWKEPRTIYLIPFLYACFPGLKYIHVLRDGRDMAFSKNQNQLRKHGRALLSWSERWFEPAPVRSLLLWERANLRAADHGKKLLGKNYLIVRFEDLCQAPQETTGQILEFLGAPLDPGPIAREEVSPPSSIGRWRQQPPELLVRLDRAGLVALRRFGYCDPVA